MTRDEIGEKGREDELLQRLDIPLAQRMLGSCQMVQTSVQLQAQRRELNLGQDCTAVV
jgi:hypothetical protein